MLRPDHGADGTMGYVGSRERRRENTHSKCFRICVRFSGWYKFSFSITIRTNIRTNSQCWSASVAFRRCRRIFTIIAIVFFSLFFCIHIYFVVAFDFVFIILIFSILGFSWRARMPSIHWNVWSLVGKRIEKYVNGKVNEFVGRR